MKSTFTTFAVAFSLVAVFSHSSYSALSEVTAKPASATTKDAADDDDFGEWKVFVDMDNQIYPSAIIAASTLKVDIDEDPNSLGAPLGLVGVRVKAPRDGAKIKVEVSSSKLIKPSVFEGKLKTKDEVYEICPVLRYDYDLLLRTKQPQPEDVTAKVTIDDKSLGEKTVTVPAHSINDCVFAVKTGDDDDDVADLSFMFAAYVNESHPMVQRILSKAIASGEVNSISGYQGSPSTVLKEIGAVWDVLHKDGFHYCDITTTSAVAKAVGAQHVRLVGDSMRDSEANCVDGTVLIASILKKMGLRTYLVSVPGHMFLGVDIANGRNASRSESKGSLADGEDADAKPSSEESAAASDEDDDDDTADEDDDSDDDDTADDEDSDDDNDTAADDDDSDDSDDTADADSDADEEDAVQDAKASPNANPNRVFIETTMLSSATFKEALAYCNKEFAIYNAKHQADLTDVDAARARGVLSIKDIRGEQDAERGDK